MKAFSFLGVAGLVSSVLSSPATHSPHTGINLAVSVPESTVSSGSGNMYMQFSAPTSYTWAAFGIGSAMSGSTIFVVYADGSGNITLSPRNGVGEVMPKYSSTLGSEATLLAGSGISNGLMVANIRFSTTSSTINVKGTGTNWISAWMSGDALNSASQSASISQHDAHAQFTMDLSQATQSEDSNPFVSSASSSATSTMSTSGVAATSTASSGVNVPVATGSSSSGNDDEDSSSYLDKLQEAHGIIMAITMIFLLPFGAIFIRIFGGPWIHAAIQLLSLCLIIAGFGLGHHLAGKQDQLYEGPGKTHTTFGTVIFALFLIQPLGGILHHMQYRKTQTRGIYGYAHVWYGRALIVMGVVNGGLGLQLAYEDSKWIIAYSVVAGVMALIYIAVIVATGLRKNKGVATRVGSKESDVGKGPGMVERN